MPLYKLIFTNKEERTGTHGRADLSVGLLFDV